MKNQKEPSEFTYQFQLKLRDVPKARTDYLVLKRIFDFVFSLLLAVPAIPLILVFGLLVKLETPGKMFYRQERVGLMGTPIFVTKIRSMYSDAESKSGVMWAKKNDARVTKVGSFIRKTRIDELPQILNVLLGDMSFIGPRPERFMFTEQFSDEVKNFEKRLVVKPGLSGLAQIRGGYESSPAEKLADDLEYIQNISFVEDFKIALETVVVVITGRGAR